MKSIQHKLKTINKDPFDRSLLKITWGDDYNIPPEKHMQRVIQNLKLEHIVISRVDAHQRLMNLITGMQP